MIHMVLMMALLFVTSLVHGQSKGWEKEWAETLEGAKKEGKLVVATSPDPVMREIAAKFKARYTKICGSQDMRVASLPVAFVETHLAAIGRYTKSRAW